MSVGLESLFRGILSSVVNSDTNGLGELRGKASFFDFLESESSAISYLSIVLSSAGMDQWSQLL